MGKNFGDGGDRGENGVRVGENMARVLTRITYVTHFPICPDSGP